MKNSKKKKTNLLIKGLVLCLLFFGLFVNIAAKDRKNGAQIVVQTRDGRTIRAELLAVKSDGLILMDSLNAADVTLKTENIRKIVVKKKGGFLEGMGWGGLIGLGGGVLLGLASGDDRNDWFPMSAEFKAVVVGL